MGWRLAVTERLQLNSQQGVFVTLVFDALAWQRLQVINAGVGRVEGELEQACDDGEGTAEGQTRALNHGIVDAIARLKLQVINVGVGCVDGEVERAGGDVEATAELPARGFYHASLDALAWQRLQVINAGVVCVEG